MFTGIIQDIGIVETIDKDGDWLVTIKTAMDLDDCKIGASVCCSGVCLTVVDKTPESFSVELSQETIQLTNVDSWAIGTRVNLEPSLNLGDELGGHFVFGHVDGLAQIKDIKQEGDSHCLTLDVDDKLAQFIASKGSVSLDGVSLTVNEVEGNSFGVNIIPHTWKQTTLGKCKSGDALNIEIDMLARYVARMMEKAA